MKVRVERTQSGCRRVQWASLMPKVISIMFAYTFTITCVRASMLIMCAAGGGRFVIND